MIVKNQGHSVAVGDLIQLVSPTNKNFLIKVTEEGQLHTHRGIIHHDQLIGVKYGDTIKSHTGSEYIVLKPTLGDLLLETPRNTQIMYPKDMGYILLKMGIGTGFRVIEAGTGSGAFSIALAWAISPDGLLYSYDYREEMQKLAKKNLSRIGLENRVVFKTKDVRNGFEEENVDALFFDLPNPFDYLEQAHQALLPGAPLGCILPTINQVFLLLPALYKQAFGYIEVCEIILRFYKPVYNRLRPTDRMVAHTGYLVFARSLSKESSGLLEKDLKTNQEVKNDET
jgi:tRNA (adenine57-N1/adenine58-N1)-methyltransferase